MTAVKRARSIFSWIFDLKMQNSLWFLKCPDKISKKITFSKSPILLSSSNRINPWMAIYSIKAESRTLLNPCKYP